jgi:methionine sulfoxide reductase heme-binding subunit
MLLAAANGRSALWYFARGTGVVSLLLLTAAVALGVLNAIRWRSERWPAFVITGLHRNVTLVALAFVGVHVLTNVADGYAPIRLVDAVVPFVSAYRPIWLGLGAVAFDLLVALIVTSLLRLRIGYHRWKKTHWLAYAAWPVALVHGLGAGTDVRSGWMLVLTFACIAVVLFAVLWRIVAGFEGRLSGRRLAGALGVLALPLALFAWMHDGPLRRGWAARAGTPAALLGGSSGTRATVSSVAVPSRFEAQLDGTLSESASNEEDDGGQIAVTVDGSLRGGFAGRMRLVLLGQRLPEGGVRMTSSTVSLGPASQPSELTGRVVDLSGAHVVAAVTEPSGRQLQLAVDLQIDSSRRLVSGVVQVAPVSQ